MKNNKPKDDSMQITGGLFLFICMALRKTEAADSLGQFNAKQIHCIMRFIKVNLNKCSLQ